MKLLYTILSCAVIISPFYVKAQNNYPNGSTLPAATPVSKPGATADANQPNYLTTWEPNMPISDTANVVNKTRTIREIRQSTTYYDGLGRVKQAVTKGASFGGRDMVLPYVYDAYGREQYIYMPYAQTTDNTNDGKFKTNPFSAQETFYKNATLNPGMAGESIFYRTIEYEASPLNRVVKNYAAGNSWSTRATENRHMVNTVADSVRIWNMGTGIPTSPGFYAAGQLFKEVFTDEQQNQIVVFRDKESNVVLKKVLQSATYTAHVGWLCTYYVYNDNSQVGFVIPPAATNYAMINSWSKVSDVAKELCYRYVYDDRNRLVVEEIPGHGEVYKVYDLRDRLVFTQDAEQRAKSPMEWYTVFYDNTNRTIMTGIYKSNTTREALQTAMNSATATSSISYQAPVEKGLTLYADDGSANYNATDEIYFMPGFESITSTSFVAELVSAASGTTTSMTATYSLPGINMSSITPLIYMYYDNYNYPGVYKFRTDDFAKLTAADSLYPETFSGSYSTLTNDLPTGMKVRVLGTDQWIMTTTYYNDKSRPIQVISSNSVGGKDITSFLYSFGGNMLANYMRHQAPKSITAEITLLTTQTYDHRDRLISVKKKLNDDSRFERTIASYSYDELNRVNKKWLGIPTGGTPIDSMLLTYNARGWLNSINKDYVGMDGSTKNWFGEELSYDYGFTSNYYNGTIAGKKWKTRSDGIPRSYGYSYDKTNRLTAADFSQQDVAGANWGNAKMDFSVSNLTYDANGGIQTMVQQGMNGLSRETMDNLTYQYVGNSNKLKTVADGNTKTSTTLGDFINGTNSGNDYTYNLNGNMTSDENRNISSITYNHLNLPDVITVREKGSITYQYDALGNKIRKTVVDNSSGTTVKTVTDYSGGFTYQNDSLLTIGHEEGRIRPLYITGKPVSYAFDYFEKDHLGSIRMVLTDQPDSSAYAATMETENNAVETATFSNIETTRVETPTGYNQAGSTTTNKYVAKTNGSTGGNKIGPSIVLRVMAGDTIQIGADAFYKSSASVGNTSNSPVSSIVAGFLQALTGSSSTSGEHSLTAADNSVMTTSLNNNDYSQLINSDNGDADPNRPKAYLNYVLFDDQFNMVNQNSGLKRIAANPDAVQHLGVDKMVMQKTGFLYVYTDNETTENVYFNNVQVLLLNGPALEETHYYPYGLTMEAISYNALKGLNYAENKYKFNGIESNRDLGLNQYDAFYRNYDPQIGKWMEIDPKPNEGSSLYTGMGNNPVLLSDLLGDTAIVGTLTLPVVEVNGRSYRRDDLIQALIDQWSRISGLDLSVVNNRIQNNGIKTNIGISMEARADILKTLDEGKIYIDFRKGGSQTLPHWVYNIVDPKTDYIVIDPNQIERLVEGTSSDLDPMTVGIGMVVLHEMEHTFLFNNRTHNEYTKLYLGNIDRSDERGNRIRAELGKKWGQRLSYKLERFGRYSYLPMSKSALQLLQTATKYREIAMRSKSPIGAFNAASKIVLPTKGVVIYRN
ncbi:DUF6443 domain-containing protein [Chitinophaga sp.]|uniref:DUF6443 domain-containing protein n=1 Tax=Chitinophaga sp. TaxID=1869181 RepID=UPI0031CEE635